MQTWISAELAEECCSICFCLFSRTLWPPSFQEDQTHLSFQHLCTSVNHPCQHLPGCPRVGTTVWCVYHHTDAYVFHIFPSLMRGKVIEVIETAVFALASRWGSFHELLLPSGPYPHPWLPSVCSWWEDFLHKLTPLQRVSICWRLHRESQREFPDRTSSPLLDYFFFAAPCTLGLTQSWLKGVESRHVCNLGLAVSSPGLSPLPSSPLPPPCLGSHGLLLWRGGDPRPLHAQVWEHRLQSHRGGIKRVRLPTWGILHADGVNALLPPVRHSGPRAEPQHPPPDRLPQEWGEHLVAEPIHVFWHPAPEFCQPHPAPG